MTKLPRFYIPPGIIRDTPQLRKAPIHRAIALTPSVIQHAVKTLRMRQGDPLILFDGSGYEYRAELDLKDGQTYTARILESSPGKPAEEPLIFLYPSPLKKEPWEWLLEKATELGAHAIVPLITKYVEVDVTQNFDKKKARWDTIVQSAAEQSERSTLPELSEPMTLQEAIKKAPRPALLFYEGESAEPLNPVLSKMDHPKELSIFIGPVGGFSDEEVQLAHSRGLLIVSLGNRVLRAETAGLAALAISAFSLSLHSRTPE